MTVRWGVLGAAAINNSTLPAIRAASNAELVAVASRREASARELAQAWGAARWHGGDGGYERLLDDPEVDAVYVPLPNYLHAEWTVRALKAGKHVLCEKPLALTLEEVDAIAAAAADAGRFVLEGFMYRFAQRWEAALRLVGEGAVGEPRVVRAAFGFPRPIEQGNYRFDPALGGGAIWDLGCYMVNMARAMFAAEPVAVSALGNGPPGGVDLSAQMLLDFGDGRAGVTHCGFDHVNPYSTVEVIGTQGWIALPGTGIRQEPFTRLLHFRTPPDEVFLDGVEPRLQSFPYADPFRLQVEHLSRCVLEGVPPRHGLDDARANTATILAILRSLREGRAVSLTA
jgi:D-xylose 1-dehydrogenase (NADP+, D-xylono-1,5-lactone-forming)